MTGPNEAANMGSSTAWPQDVGILAMDIYFPAQYVDQVRVFLLYFLTWNIDKFSYICICVSVRSVMLLCFINITSGFAPILLGLPILKIK